LQGQIFLSKFAGADFLMIFATCIFLGKICPCKLTRNFLCMEISCEGDLLCMEISCGRRSCLAPALLVCTQAEVDVLDKQIAALGKLAEVLTHHMSGSQSAKKRFEGMVA
jgi:hypothetical protein